MNQQIVVSKEIVNYLSQNLPAFRKNDALDLIEFIEQNYFVSDRNTIHFNKIIEKIEELTPSSKTDEIKKIVHNWIQEKKYFVEYEYKKTDEEQIGLAHLTDDKIFLEPFLPNKELAKFEKKYCELEVHNSQSFVRPKHYQRLKHLPTIIPLERDIHYDLVKILEPFLRDAKSIRIEDPYLPNPFAQQNVLKVIKSFPKSKFNLIFLAKNLYSKHSSKKKNDEKIKQYNSFIKKIKDLINNNYTINYSEYFQSKKHRERFIFTEKYQIYIPGGFDFLNEDGYLVKDPNRLKDTEYRYQIRIEKREFEVNLE